MYFIFGAKCAPHERRNHSHPVLWNSQRSGNLFPIPVGSLVGCINNHDPQMINICQSSFGFQVSMFDPLSGIDILNNNVCITKTFFNIPNFMRNTRDDIVVIFQDPGAVGFHRLQRIKDTRQWFIFNLNCIQRQPGSFFIFCCYGNNGITQVIHPVNG